MTLKEQAKANAKKRLKEYLEKYNYCYSGPDVSELHRSYYREELQRLKAAESKEAA